MAISVANVANTNTFDFWRNRTNELAHYMSNYVVTVGGLSTNVTGDIGINGVLGANTITVNNTINIGNTTVNLSINSTSIVVGNTGTYVSLTPGYGYFTTDIRVGSAIVNTVITSSNVKISNSTSNLTLSIPTTTQYSNGEYFLNANGSWTPLKTAVVGEVVVNSTSTTIDTFNKNIFKAVEYVVYVKDNTANNKITSKILTTHDEGTAYLTEYAVIISNNNIGAFSCTLSGTSVFLSFTPTSSSCNVRFHRVSV